MDTLHFTSDIHYDEDYILQCFGRPFKDIATYNAHIDAHFNVPGLVSLGDEDKWRGVAQFHAGNHLDFRSSYSQNGHIFSTRYKVCYLCSHYPYEVFPAVVEDIYTGEKCPAIHLHGHLHAPLGTEWITRIGNRLDVGVDGHNYLPWSEDEIIAEIKSRGLIITSL